MAAQRRSRMLLAVACLGACSSSSGRSPVADPPPFAVQIAHDSGRCGSDPRILDVVQRAAPPQLVIVCEASNPFGTAEARIEANCTDGRWSYAVGYPASLTAGGPCAAP